MVLFSKEISARKRKSPSRPNAPLTIWTTVHTAQPVPEHSWHGSTASKETEKTTMHRKNTAVNVFTCIASDNFCNMVAFYKFSWF